MEDQIFKVDSNFYKSMMVRGDEMWLSMDRVRRVESFEKAVRKTGMLKSAASIPLEAIHKIQMNEASEVVKLRYVNAKNKNKKLSLGFEEKEDAQEFGKYLGKKLMLRRSAETENKNYRLAINALYFLIAVGVTYVFATGDPGEFEGGSGSAKKRAGELVLRWLHDTIGQTGVILIGTAISLYLLYRLYMRYINPANNIVYVKEE